MTNNIYPPDHLLRKWEELIIDEGENVDVVLYEAFQAGADQQLEQDAKWLDTNALYTRNLTVSPSGDALRQVMRPKPLSLKEQALAELDLLKGDANAHGLGFDAPAIRRALESLPS